MLDTETRVRRVAPCKDCTKPNKHTVGCHCDCPEYLDFAHGRELIRARRRKEQELHEYLRRHE